MNFITLEITFYTAEHNFSAISIRAMGIIGICLNIRHDNSTVRRMKQSPRQAVETYIYI
jgi:hypothetical protein